MFVNQVGDFALNSWDYGLFGKCFFSHIHLLGLR